MLINKDYLRTQYKAVRKQVFDKKSADIAISKKIISHKLFLEADIVLTYVSFGDEVDTRRLIVYMLKNGKRVAVPYCQDKQMYFFEISSTSDIILGNDGVPTVDPIGKIPVKPTEKTLCIVPGIAFDRKGNRLGYGGGYYDRYLSKFNVNSIGLCYDNCIILEIPANNLDVKIPMILTESNEYDISHAESETIILKNENNNNEPIVPAKPKNKLFKVNISDSDYNAEPEINSSVASGNVRKRFEVKINDQDYNQPLDVSQEQPEYKGEVYFRDRVATRRSNYSNTQPAQNDSNKSETASKNHADKSVKKNKINFSRNFVAIVAAFIIIFTTAFSALGISCINDVLAIGRESETITVDIPEKATTDDVIEILADNGVIKQELFCKIYYRAITWFKNLNKSDKPADPVYKSGPHYVDKDMGLEACLMTIRGFVKENDTVTLVFPEGWTIYQIADRLDKFNVCDRNEFLKAISNGNFDYGFINEISPNSNRTFTLEGYIFPDTYEFYEESDANTVIRKFLSGFEVNWTEEMDQRARELGLTRDEVIIIASIIQREAANKEQMSMISAVLHNRLKYSATYPTLDCDSTAYYMSLPGDMTEAEWLEYTGMTASDWYIYKRCYNSYLSEGLPPGPICNPGMDAINAALYPSEKHSDYYFFQHDKFGKIYMAKNNAEHSANSKEVDKIDALD